MDRGRRWIGYALAVLCITGCGDDVDDTPRDSGRVDGAADATTDATVDAARDSQTTDGAPDAQPDDAAGDAPPDATADATGDAPADDGGGDADAALDTMGFEEFRYTSSGGPCPPETDCSGYIEVLADGSFSVDKLGELPEEVHTATLTADELAALLPVLMAPDLIALLDQEDAPCEPPTDIFESMRLVEDAETHENSVTICDDAPIEAVRTALFDLADDKVGGFDG